jgi:ABC-type nitrate/sulfonate/bicarbonate transport system permease component
LTKKSVNINEKIYPAAIILLIVVVWQLLSSSGIIPQFMLPSPINVLRAFYNNFGDLMFHARITLTEAAAGLGLSIASALILATAMDHFDWFY